MNFRRFLCALSAALCMSSLAQEVPQGVVLLSATGQQWENTPTGPRLLLKGDPMKAGPYVMLITPRPGGGPSAQAHTHPDDRTYTVVAGTWLIGFGASFDQSKLIALEAGSYYTEPAGVPHFGVAKDEGTILLITGTGPTRQVPAGPAK